MRNSSASGAVKRSSSARSSSSWPRARSAPSGSAGSVRVESTSCSVAGICSTNHATLARVPGAERRWKSSSTSASSPCSASALTSRGSTTSSTGALAASAARLSWARSGHARPSASITCDHSTTASLSPSSSVTHATGRRARLALAPGGEQRRLAEPGRAGDEAQPPAAAVAQALEQPLARDRLGGHERRVELGDEQDRGGQARQRRPWRARRGSGRRRTRPGAAVRSRR